MRSKNFRVVTRVVFTGEFESITRNHEDTEDALQETFLRAYLALDSFEGRSQFASLANANRHQFRADGPAQAPQSSRKFRSSRHRNQVSLSNV